MNNLKKFRELSQIPPETFSKLLLIQKRRYLMMERETATIPEYTLIMISQIYGINKNTIFEPLENISETDIKSIESIAAFDPKIKEVFLANRLTGKNRKRVFSSDIQKAKELIMNKKWCIPLP